MSDLLDELLKRANNGDADAQNNLGNCYCNGVGVTQNYEQAVIWYTKAAEQGNTNAQYNLGGCYRYGNGVNQDYNKAIEWLTKAVEQGHASARCELGLCYLYGEGVTRDYAQAVKWFTQAAEQGEANAQCNLGLCYYYGKGVEQDFKQAILWYAKAAERGNETAKHNLAMLYDDKGNPEYNIKKAIELFLELAHQGNKFAQNTLAIHFINGHGVDENPVEAVKWFKKSADQDNFEAQKNLEHCYRFGVGVKKSTREANKWKRKYEEKGELYSIALFDVLGTSENIKHKGTKKVLELYSQAIKIIQNAKSGVGKAPVPVGGWRNCVFAAFSYVQIDVAYFSDTFIIWLKHGKTNRGNAFWLANPVISKYPLLFAEPNEYSQDFLPSENYVFLNACLEFFCKGLQNGIPLRGCIATGNAYMNKKSSVFLGEALVEAARGEAVQNSVGFAFGPSFKSFHPIFNDFFIPYNKHVKTSKDVYLSPLAVDWPRFWRNHFSDINFADVIKSMKKEEFSTYYDNALVFYSFSDKNQDWPEKIKNRETMRNIDDYYHALDEFLKEVTTE